MQKLRIFYLVIIASILLVHSGCSDSGERERLFRAEEMMESHPDSAFQILDSVNALSLNEEERALYGLLLTQAMDKNHMSLEEDTIIDESVAYFRRKQDEKRLAMSVYYQGRAYQSRKMYGDAILSFFNAKEISEKIWDNFFSGLACRGIGDIYCELKSSEDELEYAKKSYAYMRQSGKKLYELYALNDLGLAYFNTMRLDSALLIGEQLEREAGDDEALTTHACRLRALSLLEKERFAEACPLWVQLTASEDATTRDSLNLCRALIGAGDTAEAEQLFNEISDDGTALNTLVRLLLASKRGDLNSAFTNLVRYDAEVQNMFENAQRQKLATTISDYFELHNRLYQQQARTARMRNITFFVILLLCVVILLLVTYFYRNRQRQKLKENIEKIQRLTDDMQLLEEGHLRLSESHRQIELELNKSTDRIKRTEEEVRRLGEKEVALRGYLSDILEQRLNMLRRMRLIMDQVQSDSDKENIQEMREILKKIEPFTREYEITKEELAQLEIYLDLLHDGVMAKFRKDVSLSETDYDIYLLSLLSQPCSSIAGLLGLNGVSQAYTRRKYIRKIIERDTSAEKAAEYVRYLQKGIIS